MDADFWQQDRGAPFGLHPALATNHMHHSQAVLTHLQHQQQQHNQPQHFLAQQSSPPPLHHIPLNSGQQDNSLAIADQQHQHLHRQHRQHEHQNQNLTHLGAEQSHHLLLNAAAAAAAAAHLSGVVKSNEMSSSTAINDDKINSINNNNTNKNNNSNKQNITTKQEPHAANSNSNGGVYGVNTANINTLTQHTTSSEHQQQGQLIHSSQHIHKQQLEDLHHQIQQQTHHNERSRILSTHNNVTHKHENPQENIHSHDLHQLQQHQHQHQQHLAAEAEETSHKNADSSTLDQQQPQHLLPISVPRTSPIGSTSPLHLSVLAQTPTSSPQPSLTSPSGGSSTPDLKFSTDNNNKLPNDMQVRKYLNI